MQGLPQLRMVGLPLLGLKDDLQRASGTVWYYDQWPTH
jgi:hypothetical protein